MSTLEISPYAARPVIATATAVTSSPVEDIAADAPTVSVLL